jgi:hypothetical protein
MNTSLSPLEISTGLKISSLYNDRRRYNIYNNIYNYNIERKGKGKVLVTLIEDFI